jgi:hypothetical protein
MIPKLLQPRQNTHMRTIRPHFPKKKGFGKASNNQGRQIDKNFVFNDALRGGFFL